MKAEDYADAAEKLKPDIVVGLGDIPHGRALGAKRIEKATDRNIEWLQDHVDVRRNPDSATGHQSKLFAPLLPVSCAAQQYYVDALTQDMAQDIDGLAVYSTDTLEDLPDELRSLPKLALTEPSTPHEVLNHVSLGLDVLTVPFITAATDAGIALDFTFPDATSEERPASLGVDMWLEHHATSLDPLVKGCECYACTNHHRAYVQHLLNAKEMLAWVLLQVHNHHMLDRFFAGVRQTLRDGNFEEQVEHFAKVYESHLPEKTGRGPRVRGYQFKSEGPGEPKKNPTSFQTLNDRSEKLSESITPSPDTDAADLEKKGFAERDS
jgi:queuine tRNA-ribosyltransferase subunit QTRTD1